MWIVWTRRGSGRESRSYPSMIDKWEVITVVWSIHMNKRMISVTFTRILPRVDVTTRTNSAINFARRSVSALTSRSVSTSVVPLLITTRPTSLDFERERERSSIYPVRIQRKERWISHTKSHERMIHGRKISTRQWCCSIMHTESNELWWWTQASASKKLKYERTTWKYKSTYINQYS